MTKRVILYLGDAPSLMTAAILDRANKAVVQDPNAPESALLWKLGRPGVVTLEARPDGSQVVTPVGIGEAGVACLERTKAGGVVNTTGHDEIILEVRPASGNHVIVEIGQPDPTLIVPLPVAPAGLTPEQTKSRADFIASLDERVKTGNITRSAANKQIAAGDAQFLASQGKPTQQSDGKLKPGEIAGASAAAASGESDVRRAARQDAAARLGLPKTATWADIADAQGKL